MSVDVSVNIGEYFTWDDCEITWDNAGFTWDLAAVTDYAVDVSEQFAFADKAAKRSSKLSAEKFALSDNLGKKIFVVRTDKAKFLDSTYKKEAVDVSEQFAFADKAAKRSSKLSAEKFAVTEIDIAKSLLAYIVENLKISETYWDNIKFHINVCENILMDDQLVKQFAKNKKEGFQTRDTFFKLFEMVVDEQLRTTDIYYKSIFGSLVDAFYVSDRVAKRPIIYANEQILLDDKKSLLLAVLRNEKLSFSDFFRPISLWSRRFYESMRVADNVGKNANILKRESFKVRDNASKNFENLSQEDIRMADELYRQYKAERRYNEGILFGEYVNKNVALANQESFALHDAFIRACEAVLSNIYATHGDMDLEEFLELVNTPAGFSAFTDFKVGEYEYQEALVRILIESKVMQSQPSVTDVVMHVDIPDTDDRGIVQITDTSQATKVYYNKFYYHPPEVNVVVIGGSTADGLLRPALLSTDKSDDGGRYFEVEIRNSSNQRATGTISWMSKGY